MKRSEHLDGIHSIHESDLNQLFNRLYREGKSIVELEDATANQKEYSAVVSIREGEQLTHETPGKGVSRTEAIMAANANLEEGLAYEEQGYSVVRRGPYKGAWVNVYMLTEPAGDTVMKAVVKRSGYGEWIIESSGPVPEEVGLDLGEKIDRLVTDS